jgi:hypothetical protein
MSPTESATSSGGKRAGGRSTRDQAAAAAVTGVVYRFTDLTKAWLDKSAEGFATSFDNALKPDYTADQLVKDVTGVWVRNLEYLGSLASIFVPPEEPPSGSRTVPGQSPPGAEDQKA